MDTKGYFILFLLLPIFLFVVFGLFTLVSAGTLSCVVTTTCSTGTVMFRISATANGHAELSTQSNYANLICCSGVIGLGSSCAGTVTSTILKFSSSTNASVERNTQSNYPVKACISLGSGGTSSIGYQANNCSGFDTTLASIVTTTNSHVGDANAYTTKVCATASGGNAAPSVSGIVLNHGNPITLTSNTTTSIDINYTVADSNGCSDVVNTTSSVFRNGASSTCALSNPSINNLNCYLFTTHSTSSCSGNAFNATDTVQIYYFAQATDASSSFASDNWSAFAMATDATNATGTATSSGVEVNTLLAINITPTTTAYGSLSPGANTGSTNKTSTIQNAGNCSTTLQISGIALALGSNTLATSSQHYGTSTFTYGGSESALSGTPATVSGFLLTSPTSTNSVSSLMFWGIGVSNGNATGTYSGTNTFTALFNP